MSRPISFAVMALAGALTAALQCHERAHESIRQDDLCADPFFLTGGADPLKTQDS